MIKRSLAVAHVNHEFVPEYLRLHDEIPAAVLEEYRKYGTISISCFLDEDDILYIYHEYVDSFADVRIPENMPNDVVFQALLEPGRDYSFKNKSPREVFRYDAE